VADRKQMWIPGEIVVAAEAEAQRRRKKTGELVRWSDIVNEWALAGMASWQQRK
jgi:hypothetical protein